MHPIKQIILSVSCLMLSFSDHALSSKSSPIIFDDSVEASGVKVKTLQKTQEPLKPENFPNFTSGYNILSGFVGSTYCPGNPSSAVPMTQVMDGCLGVTNIDPQTNLPTFMGLGVGDGYGRHFDAVEDQAIIHCVQEALQKILYPLYASQWEFDTDTLHDTIYQHLNKVAQDIMQQKGYSKCSPGTTIAFAIARPFKDELYHLIVANMGDSYIGVFHPDPKSPQWTTLCAGRKDPYGGVAKFPSAMTKQDLEVRLHTIHKGDFVIVATDGFSDELPYEDTVETDNTMDIESDNSFRTRHFDDEKITHVLLNKLANQKIQDLDSEQFRDILKQLVLERANKRRFTMKDQHPLGDDVGVLVGHLAVTQPSLLTRIYNNIRHYL